MLNHPVLSSRFGFPSLLAAALFATLTLPARAGVGAWTPVGPEGGSVTVLAASPTPLPSRSAEISTEVPR